MATAAAKSGCRCNNRASAYAVLGLPGLISIINCACSEMACAERSTSIKSGGRTPDFKGMANNSRKVKSETRLVVLACPDSNAKR
eukprot:scaffold34623_cov274-Amphora_coffeaeformis.AAC.9